MNDRLSDANQRLAIMVAATLGGWRFEVLASSTGVDESAKGVRRAKAAWIRISDDLAHALVRVLHCDRDVRVGVNICLDPFGDLLQALESGPAMGVRPVLCAGLHRTEQTCKLVT